MPRTNFEVHVKHCETCESTGEMRVMMKFYPDVYTSTLNFKRSLVSIDATEKKITCCHLILLKQKCD